MRGYPNRSRIASAAPSKRAVAAGWSQRCWPVADAAFVNDDPDVTLIADDGSRRGDGAAVLVAHTTADHKEAMAALREKRPPRFTGA